MTNVSVFEFKVNVTVYCKITMSLQINLSTQC